MQKDYCPGFIDLAAGGVVDFADQDVDLSAKREVLEELGIDSTDPKFLFKVPYSDDVTQAWIHVYIQLYLDGSPLKPQESEIDALFFWKEDQIQEKIRSKAKITPDGVKVWELFLPKWQEILKSQNGGF